jgi:CRP-like cAMP-binding protein
VQLASFGESAAVYRLRFFIEDIRYEREARDEVQEALWYALRRAGIDMPYPQQTISFRERAAEVEERRRKEHLAEAQDLLDRIDFVAALDPDARRTLAERARYLEYGPGQAVVRQGESGDAFYLVAHGEVAVRVAVEAAGNGKAVEKEVAKLGRGAFFGEMSLLTGDPRTATVVAVNDASLLAVDRDAFERVFTANPSMAQGLADVIARRRLGLASAKAEGIPQAAVEKEAKNLLGRIRNIFRPR